MQPDEFKPQGKRTGDISENGVRNGTPKVPKGAFFLLGTALLVFHFREALYQYYYLDCAIIVLSEQNFQGVATIVIGVPGIAEYWRSNGLLGQIYLADTFFPFLTRLHRGYDLAQKVHWTSQN